MSVDAPKNLSSGFLRDFHFSTMADSVIADLFGEVEPPSWMKFTIGHTQDPDRRQFVFTITVTIEPPKVSRSAAEDRAMTCLQIAKELHPNSKRNELEGKALELMDLPEQEFWDLANRLGITRLVRTVPRKRKQFFFDFAVPDTVIREMRDELGKLFMKWVRKTLLDNAYRLYEFDPRIGWKYSGQNGLPRCPLFDPPEEFARTGLPMESRDGSIMFSSCAFCGKEHNKADAPVWSGANMMWVHDACWRKTS